MRRRSANVHLIAMGTVILSGCGPDLPSDRYVYKQHHECVRDWGEANCEHSTVSHGGGGGSGGGGHYCYGPRYNTSVKLPSGSSVWSGSGQQHAIHPDTGKIIGLNSVDVARGGFGSSSHFSLGSGG